LQRKRKDHENAFQICYKTIASRFKKFNKPQVEKHREITHRPIKSCQKSKIIVTKNNRKQIANTQSSESKLLKEKNKY
jgi:hypothetical protein